MGAIASFDFPTFSARYPEFASLSPTLAAAYFTEATLYHRNDGMGPVQDAATQLMLLNMLTAQIAFLNSGANGQAPTDLVGRISSASEGSVSVSVDLPSMPQGAAWFAQTKYGMAYWAATTNYRRGSYYPGPQRSFEPGLRRW